MGDVPRFFLRPWGGRKRAPVPTARNPRKEQILGSHGKVRYPWIALIEASLVEAYQTGRMQHVLALDVQQMTRKIHRKPASEGAWFLTRRRDVPLTPLAAS